MEVGSGQYEKEVAVANKQNITWGDFALRLLAFANTFMAALLLGLDKQTKLVGVQLIPTLPPVDIPVTAKWSFMSAFVYFVVVNGIACAYAAVSLVLMLSNRGQKRSSMMLTVLDLLMVALIFSAGGAAFAVGLIGFKGNSHLRWNKVCNIFGKFCAQVGGAVTVSLAGGAFFLLLVFLAVSRLHNKHR